MNCQRLQTLGLASAMLGASAVGAGLNPNPAAAFCGFYVAGADTQLYANATMVVLMREGTKTVLSMQNNYEGPAEDFAMIIPVPAVLNEEQVKVLPDAVFEHVDELGAPRLVEYWEQDPCLVFPPPGAVFTAAAAPTPGPAAPASNTDSLGVTIEAQFTVGEYEVVILSAEDSSGLDTWLRTNEYNIPDGAEDVLAPYVAEGTKFFVAKVDPEKVTFNGKQAALSPLRFHYDSENFSLPVRLGLLNSQGTQDLIVNILATDRYELANYPNVTIPTNLRVHDEVRQVFGGFYESLFTETIEKNPGAIVTEYSWAATTCDPCPTQPLSPQDLLTLGQDVISPGSQADQPQIGFAPPQASNVTLTRLHYRYTSETLAEDLVFQRAEAIVGGRGMPDKDGKLPSAQTTPPNGFNNFQGRYVILHPWEDEITCDAPQRGMWGGPPGQGQPQPLAAGNQALTGASPSAENLPQLVAEAIPELDVKPLLALDPLEVRSGDLPEVGSKPDEASDDTASDDTASDDTSATAGASAPDPASPEADSGDADAATDVAGPTVTSSDGCSCRVGGGQRPLPLAGLSLFAGAVALWTRRRRRRRS